MKRVLFSSLTLLASTPALAFEYNCNFGQAGAFQIIQSGSQVQWVENDTAYSAQMLEDQYSGVVTVMAHPNPADGSIKTASVYVGSEFGDQIGVPKGAAQLVTPVFLSNGAFAHKNDPGQCEVLN